MNNTPLLDLLFTLVLLFFSTTIIYAMMVSPEDKKKKNIEAKAEFIITVTWDDGSSDDVDLYCEDPQGGIVFFGNKTVGLMHLDRDDLGQANDTIRLPSGEIIIIKSNREQITIRGTTAGEYVVNVQMYNKYDGVNRTPVKVTITKLNPYSIVMEKTVVLEQGGQEITICRFTVDEEGTVTDVNELDKKLIGDGLGAMAPPPPN
jgi:hypothetical protein